MARRDRLSALDAMFLPMETDTQSLHIGSVLVLEGPAPDPGEFRSQVAEQLARVPVFGRRVLRMPLELGRPVWVDVDDFRPAEHVRHVVLEHPGDEARLRAMVGQIMAPRLDAGRPLWELWQVDGLSEGRWAVVAKAHHTMVDGQSGADVVQTLLSTSPGTPTAPRGVEERRPAASPVALAADLLTWLVLLPVRAARLLVRSLLAPREARRRIARVRLGLAQVLRPDLPPSVLNGPLGSRRVWGWARADLGDATRVARASGGTVNDVYLAALAGGYRRYLVDRGEPVDAMVLRAIVPVSRRAAGRPRARAGTLASAMFVELPVGLADPAARLAAVRGRTVVQKSAAIAEATAAVVRLADHIPSPLLFRATRAYARSGQGRVNVVASNVTGPAQVEYLAGRRLLELVPYVPVAQEVRTTTAMLSYAGRLAVGITGDAESLPDIDRLVAAVEREFAVLESALVPGATPFARSTAPLSPGEAAR